MSEDLSALSDEELKAKREAYSQIRAGDVVKLKSGGPELTVASASNGWAYVRWFMGASLQGAEFELTHLERALKDADTYALRNLTIEMVSRIRAVAKETDKTYHDAYRESVFYDPAEA